MDDAIWKVENTMRSRDGTCNDSTGFRLFEHAVPRHRREPMPPTPARAKIPAPAAIARLSERNPPALIKPDLPPGPFFRHGGLGLMDGCAERQLPHIMVKPRPRRRSRQIRCERCGLETSGSVSDAGVDANYSKTGMVGSTRFIQTAEDSVVKRLPEGADFRWRGLRVATIEQFGTGRLK